MKGKWASAHFGNNNPIVLELACGMGDYARSLAKIYPDKNFIGVDIKGNRLWSGAVRAESDGLTNVCFLRCEIELLYNHFAKNEVDSIWITFPDPQLKERRAKKRLTNLRFINVYRQFLQKEGLVQLKTDSPELFTFTLETLEKEKIPVIERIDNIYTQEKVPTDLTEIQTKYEKMHLKDNRTIRFVSFKVQ
ncbi:UNVERIFIED_CONTAM: hypothetical protein GTU68_000102 [Idotea baltica]|nr:hypothetical protein [Idotea baltica]